MQDTKLIVVRRGQFATFDLLARTFGDDPSVHVIWDRRRMGERRQSAHSSGESSTRRSGDRRSPPPSHWGTLSYLVAATAGPISDH